MSSAVTMEMLFVEALKKPPGERTHQELNLIFAFLHGLESLGSIRELALRELCKNVRYEFRAANDILYHHGDLATSWYVLLTGSVFIEGSMFLPRNSFGKRQAGCPRRPNECLILEPSEMIAIDYPNVQLMKPGSRSSIASGGYPASDRLYVLDGTDGRMRHARHHSDSSTDQLPPELQHVHSVLQHSEQHYLRSNPIVKRNSRASDTSSAYSGSDRMQSSVDDSEMDLSGLGLVESMVDSDDEEVYNEHNESLIVRDTVRECLEKDPAERTEDDIETLLDFMQHLPAFANMTLAIRRALCAVMVFAVVEKMGTIVMNEGEELDSWSVILNGHVEIERPDGAIEHLHMGDSFGITPTMEKLYHKGIMRTKMDDCQFVCIAQSDYYRILHQGEENTRRHTESGEVVLVTEHRILDSGNRKGHIVIRGTPERLMQHLVEEHSSVDPTYVEDFLLTYRTFLKTPDQVAQKLLMWFDDAKIRDRVTRVVLLWVNNHFNDFETETAMAEFLEKFEQLLERERMGGQLRLLNIACAAKARPRNVVLNRAKRDEILHFSVLGGIERNCGLFISKVEKKSKAHEAGLKRGDQILEVNNQNFEHISHNKALEILRGTTHLSITVKSNLLGFREMLLTPENSPRTPKKGHSAQMVGDPKQRLSAPDLEAAIQPVLGQSKMAEKKGFMSTGHRAKIRKALMKFNFMPGPRNGNSDPQLSSLDDAAAGYVHVRKGSSSSNNSSPIHTPHLSASNPDLTSVGQYLEERGRDYPEHVLRVYRADQTCKYFLVHRETTAREVVMLAVQEFSISEPSSQYSLCEVTAEQEGLIKQKRLPEQMTCLPDRIGLNSRYYLRNNMSTEPLVPDELASELTKENSVTFLQLNSSEVAAQLTLRDFQLFHEIEFTEYIDDLFDLPSRFGVPHLSEFSELVNQEMFWVVSEVCGELNIVKRMKIIKQFIKIARHCKECKNFNSMFAIISGLGHGCVSRLRNTWEKVPTKYAKTFEDLQDLMDPSRNMSKYRNLLNSEMVQPPMIPFFPVVKKDLTFIHLGNDSKVDSLINFEKLRMIAKEVRHICNMASAQYDLANMLIGGGNSQSVFSAFSNISAGSMATMRRKRRVSTLPNPKKMYEEAQMVRRVKAYLSTMVIVEDEARLQEMSHQCEQPTTGTLRKRDASPNPSASSQEKNLGPKFGAESPQAVRKLMALSEKSRPHNPKLNPLPPHHSLGNLHSPSGGRRPLSPRPHSRAQAAVHLSAESSSVVSLGNMALRKSTTTNSVGSNESASPTNSIGSYQQQYETDSGHNSLASSTYDSHSTSSVGSASSPPSQKRQQPPLMQGPPSYLPPPPPSCRPPLPPYHVVVQNSSTAYSQYLQHQCGTSRDAGRGRPPLPDYHTATRAQRARGKYNSRANSHEGALGYYNNDSDNNDDLEDDGDSEEEIISAV